MDSTIEVYNFTVESCHNYFVGSTAVLVHNEHDGLLGKIGKYYADVANKLKSLSPDLAAKVETYIQEFGGTKLEAYLTQLNVNPAKLDELVDRLKRTAGSVKKRNLITQVSGSQSPELSVEKFNTLKKYNTADKNNLTAHHIPADYYMSNKGGVGVAGYKYEEGLCILVEASSVSGQVKAARHGRTKSFGNSTAAKKQEYLNLSPKEALQRDIDDLRELYIDDGVYNASVEKALQDLIQQTKTKYSPTFN